jgi:hypothetical protein
VFHLLQLLLKILLKAEGEPSDNSRLASSFFIGGAWLLLVTQLFPIGLALARVVPLGRMDLCGSCDIHVRSQEDTELAGEGNEATFLDAIEVIAGCFD